MPVKNMNELISLFDEFKGDERFEGASDVVNEYMGDHTSLLTRSTETEQQLASAQGKIDSLTEDMNELNGTIEQIKKENTELKAKNYDLLLQVGEPIEGGKMPIENKLGPDGEVYHIDSLFQQAQFDPMNPGNPMAMNGGNNAEQGNQNSGWSK